MMSYEWDKNDSNNDINIDRTVCWTLLVITSIITTVIAMRNCNYVISVDGN